MRHEGYVVLGSLLVGIVSVGAIIIVQKKGGLHLQDAATTVATVIGAVAAFLVFRTLVATQESLAGTQESLKATQETLKAANETFHADHEWRRRHYTAELMSHWNERARSDIAFLEHHFPKYYPVPDFSKNTGQLDQWHIDADYAKTVVKSVVNSTTEQPPNPIDLEVRDRLVRLFNYFEDVSVAYELDVIDRESIAESFGSVMIEIYLYYQPFVVEMGRLLYRQPWPPFSRIVQLWISQARLQAAARDRDLAEESWKQTISQAKLMQAADQQPEATDQKPD